MALLILISSGCNKEDNNPTTIHDTVNVVINKYDTVYIDTSNRDTVMDVEGNIYHTITIGTQTWMVENLRTSHYNDGTEIPYVAEDQTWATLNTPAYCSYNNLYNAYTINSYGFIYNGYAVKTGKLCPKGWHVPSDGEWTILENYLMTKGYNYDNSTNGNNYAKALSSAKEWNWCNVSGSVGNEDFPNKRNATGFSALPAGYRVQDGFHSIYLYGGWWCSTEYEYRTNNLYDRYITYNYSKVFRASSTYQTGLSVRCIKD